VNAEKANSLMPSLLSPTDVTGPSSSDKEWLEAFHAGSREAMTQCYTDHFASVERAVGKVLRGADKETVIHEVFLRLLNEEALRRRFVGGSMRAWIGALAKNHAIDYWRRQQHETPAGDHEDILEDATDTTALEAGVEARMMIQRFREACLPKKWERVFDLRFVQQLDQGEVARILGMHRTTLIYQEFRLRQLLRKFFLQTDVV
jgi:RNA polymerase sigma-70 factor, ECF subfamily